MTSDLPVPAPLQPYFIISVLEGGHLGIPEHIIVDGGSPSQFMVLPVLSFLLRHSESDKKVIFDLGLRKDWQSNPPEVVKRVKQVFGGPVEIPVDVVDSLRKGGLEADDIDTIIISHIHFDHVGNPTLFPSSRFAVGGDAEGLLANGYDPEDTEPASNPYFARNLFPKSRTSFLSYKDWTPIGPFPRAHDFFGDGSMYLIDAAGHLPGHINALVRTSADGSWVLLAGDSAHDPRIITGEKEIGMYHNPMTGNLACMHGDLESAKKHIERIKKAKALGKVEVILAHDIGWFGENREKDVIFPGRIRSL